MSPMLRIASAVLVIAVVVGGTLYILRPSDQAAAPGPSPTPSAAAVASATPTTPAASSPASSSGVVSPVSGPAIVFAMSPGYGGGPAWLQVEPLSGEGGGALSIAVDGNLADPAWSPDGTQITFTASSDTTAGLWFALADGSAPQLLYTCAQPCAFIDHPSWAPDGTQIAWAETDVPTGAVTPTGSRLMVMQLSGADALKPRVVVSSDATGGPQSPSWSPEGQRLVYWVARDDVGGHVVGGSLHIVGIDGTGDRNLTDTAAVAGGLPDWSPDGKSIVFESDAWKEDMGHNIYTIGVDGTGLRAVTDLTPSAAKTYLGPRWTPDGKRIVYVLEPMNGPGSVGSMNADGTDPVVLFGGGGRVFPETVDQRQ